MIDKPRRTVDLPIKTGVSAPSDRLVFIYSATSNTSAQTATIAVSDLYSNLITDPANSNTTVIAKGTLLFSNSFGYFAVANNVLKRFPLSSF